MFHTSFWATICFDVYFCLIMLVLVSIYCHRPANSVLESGDEVRPPLPVVRETLYDDAAFYGYVIFLNFHYWKGFYVISSASLFSLLATVIAQRKHAVLILFLFTEDS